MQCKGCDYPHSEVVYTTHNEAKNSTTRRRQCLRCGARFTTIEKHREPKPLTDDRYPTATPGRES